MLLYIKAMSFFQNKASEIYCIPSLRIRPSDSLYLRHIATPTKSLSTLTFTHVRMVKLIKLGTTAMIHHMQLRMLGKNSRCHLIAHHLYRHIRTLQ